MPAFDERVLTDFRKPKLHQAAGLHTVNGMWADDPVRFLFRFFGRFRLHARERFRHRAITARSTSAVALYSISASPVALR